MMSSEEDLPDPKLVNPERYVAAISAFAREDDSLHKETVKNHAGENLEDELEDLVDFGILYHNVEDGKAIYRPRDDYTRKLSEECEAKISLVYNTAKEMLEEDGSEGIIKILEYRPSVTL